MVKKLKIILIITAVILGIAILGFILWYFLYHKRKKVDFIPLRENYEFSSNNRLYCGNNRNNPRLLSGQQVLGSRYQCFKKGVGVGKNLPKNLDDDNYAPLYQTQKIFCGNGDSLPEGYDRLGLPFECLQKGVGVGKSIQ